MRIMVRVQRSQPWLRKRKMLTVLPLLAIPFLTMGFWAFNRTSRNGPKEIKGQGLNLNLPGSNLSSEGLSDKLSFYDKAAKDSEKLALDIQRDQGFQKQAEDLFSPSQLNSMAEKTASRYNQSLNATPFNSLGKKPEDEIMKKLALLEGQLGNSKNIKNDAGRSQATKYSVSDPSLSGNMDRLEEMMQSMKSGEDNDSEMNKMGAVLDKILDIQHPERVKERRKENSAQNNNECFSVRRLSASASIGSLDTERTASTQNRFFGTDDDLVNDDQNAIEAVVHGTQTLVNGAVIKLRLLNDLYLAGTVIPKQSFAYGICTLNGERLQIEIRSIRCNNSIFPVKLTVFSMDGLPGIYIPGTITRDAAKQSADNSLQLMQLNALDPSLKAQATATGIDAVKNLLSKKAKLVKVTVKAGYKVLLRQNDNG